MSNSLAFKFMADMLGIRIVSIHILVECCGGQRSREGEDVRWMSEEDVDEIEERQLEFPVTFVSVEMPLLTNLIVIENEQKFSQ